MATNPELNFEQFPANSFNSTQHSARNFVGLASSRAIQVILSIAVVHVTDFYKMVHEYHAVFDCRSQVSLITKLFTRLLTLTSTRSLITITGVNAFRTVTYGVQSIEISSRFNDFAIIVELYVPPIGVPLIGKTSYLHF